MPAIIWARNTHCTERNAKQKAMPNKWPHSTPAALALVVSTALLAQAKKTFGHFPCVHNTAAKVSPAHARAGLPAEQARKHERWDGGTLPDPLNPSFPISGAWGSSTTEWLQLCHKMVANTIQDKRWWSAFVPLAEKRREHDPCSVLVSWGTAWRQPDLALMQTLGLATASL